MLIYEPLRIFPPVLFQNSVWVLVHVLACFPNLCVTHSLVCKNEILSLYKGKVVSSAVLLGSNCPDVESSSEILEIILGRHGLENHVKMSSSKCQEKEEMKRWLSKC